MTVVVALALGAVSCTSDGESASSQSAASESSTSSATTSEAPGNVPATAASDALTARTGAADSVTADGPTADPPGADPAESSSGAVSDPAASSGAVQEGAPTTSAPAIGLSETGHFGRSVTAQLTQVDPVQAAPIVGATEEPAVSVTIEIDNGSGAPIGLDSVVVTMTDSAGNPAPRFNDSSAAPFAGMMVQGGKAQATYIFAVPNDARNPVTITIARAPSSPTLAFAGDIAVS